MNKDDIKAEALAVILHEQGNNHCNHTEPWSAEVWDDELDACRYCHAIAATAVDALTAAGLLPERTEWVVTGTERNGKHWIDIGGENIDEMSWTREEAEDAARQHRAEHGYPDAHVERRFVTGWRAAE